MGIYNTGVGQATTGWLKDTDLSLADLDFGTPKSGGQRAAATTLPSDTEVLEAFIDEMYGQFAPDEVAYEAKSEEQIRESVAAWLRPGYDQAIANRQTQTQTNKANLDADAIARGMGASTYVTDVKNRQQNAEASDIAALEADYGSALAKYVSEGADSEEDRRIEVETFNAEQRQNAYDLAYDAALELFAQYKKQVKRSSGTVSTEPDVVATSRENCETFLGLLSGEERREVHEATTSEGAVYRAELIASVGTLGYIELMGMYPSTP